MKLGEKIKLLREEKNLSQKNLVNKNYMLLNKLSLNMELG